MIRLFLIAILFVLSLILPSCERNDLSAEEFALINTICGVKNPVKDLAWIQDIINKAEDKNTRGSYAGTIQLILHQGQPYFIYQRYVMSCMACEVYDCEGNKLLIISEPEKHMAIIEQMSEKNIIYRSPFP